MRVLVVRLSALGDVVCSLPVARALRDAGHEVSWLVGPAARPIVERHPGDPARVHVSCARRCEARRVGYDVAIDPQGLAKSAALARLTGAPRRIGFVPWQVRERPASLLYTETVEARAAHVVERNLELLRPLGIDVPPGTARFDLEAVVPPAPDWECLAGRPVGLVVGGTWETKRWAPERWSALGAALRARGVPVAVFWGPADHREARRVASDAGAALAPPSSFLEMGAAFRACRLVVAPESGSLHLAAALGVPTVALCGPTAAARNGPYRAGGTAGVAVEADVPCRPCHGRVCPTGRFVCMPSIGVEAVLDACGTAACAAAT